MKEVDDRLVNLNIQVIFIYSVDFYLSNEMVSQHKIPVGDLMRL